MTSPLLVVAGAAVMGLGGALATAGRPRPTALVTGVALSIVGATFVGIGVGMPLA